MNNNTQHMVGIKRFRIEVSSSYKPTVVEQCSVVVPTTQGEVCAEDHPLSLSRLMHCSQAGITTQPVDHAQPSRLGAA
jgi:hypothetical protein